jgi:AAA15 family ATPase/GTPase
LIVARTPYITRFLVGAFHGNKNAKNAQLIFTTHDTTLLDLNLLRRDQVSKPKHIAER